MIRNDLTTILGEELRFLAIQTRQRLNLTQKEMGERLHMSYSNYSDIETGQIECCSTLTAILLLGCRIILISLLATLVSSFRDGMKGRCSRYDECYLRCCRGEIRLGE